MNRIIKTAVIAASAAIGMLAVGGTALADAPDGNPTPNVNSKVASEPRGEAHNLIAWGSSALIQNGQFVSGRLADASGWQNQAGQRAANVQAELASTGLGSQG